MKTCRVIPLIIALLMSLNGPAEGGDLLRLRRGWNRSEPLAQRITDNFSKGRTAAGLKDFALAAKYFEKAVGDAPLSAEYLIHLALAYDKLGGRKGIDNTWGKWEILALIYYRACLAADPKGELGAKARKQALKVEVRLETKNRRLVKHAYSVIPAIGGPKGVARQNWRYGDLAQAFAGSGDSEQASEALSHVRNTIPRYDFPADNRYYPAREDPEGMDHALIGVIESYLTRGRPEYAGSYVRKLNDKGRRALCALLCAQALAETGDMARARPFLAQAAALGVTKPVYLDFGKRICDIPTEIAITRAMLGDIAGAKADLPGLKVHQQAQVLAGAALSLAKSGNAKSALAVAAEMRTTYRLNDGSDGSRTFARIRYVSRIAEVIEALAENDHAAEAETTLGEVTAMISGSALTVQNSYDLYRAHMAVGDIKAAEEIYRSRLHPPLSYAVVGEHARLQGRMRTAEVADWLRLGDIMNSRLSVIRGYAPRGVSPEDADPDKLAGSITTRVAAVVYGRRLIRELDMEWKQAKYAPKGRRRYDEAVPETADSAETAQEKEEEEESFITAALNYVIAAFLDRSRPIWHRIFVNQTEGWLKATIKYVALCIGGLVFLVAVGAAFDGDGGEAFGIAVISTVLVATAYVIG